MDKIDVLVVAEKAKVARKLSICLSKNNFKIKRIHGVDVFIFIRNNSVWGVVGLAGHLMDYDFPVKYNKWDSVDPKELFLIEPIRIIRQQSIKYVNVLKELGSYAKLVILALDADVEGEGIAFEVMDIVRKINPYAIFKRALFSSLDCKEIENSFNSLKEPNVHLANKVYARMKVDLAIGAAFTRALTLLVQRQNRSLLSRGHFLSYGPCQTPVLYLVVKQALKREKFIEKKYYVLEITTKINGLLVRFTSKKNFEKLEDARNILSKISGVKWGTIFSARYTKADKHPPVPLDTIELERRCSKFLNIRAKETLDIAENLYRDGVISYPRTETTIYPSSFNFKEILNRLRKSESYRKYIEVYLTPPFTPTKGNSDDKAHPPIYPVRYVSKDIITRKYGVKAWKIYDLICRHFLATLSTPAVIERQKITLKISSILFETSGVKIIDEGYWKIYPYEKIWEKPLPKVKEGEKVIILNIKILERKTLPPPFLSESELLKLMKMYGIGTDATMQEHINTNIKRKYFYIEKKRCIPTPLGKAVITALNNIVPELINPEVRGNIESTLQKIVIQKIPPNKIVQEIKEKFLKLYEKMEEKENILSKLLINSLIELRKTSSGKTEFKSAKDILYY